MTMDSRTLCLYVSGIKTTVFIFIVRLTERRSISLKNNNVCFEAEAEAEIIPAEEACKWSVRYLSVIGFGKAYLINDNGEKIRGLNAIMRHYTGRSEHTYNEIGAKLATVIKIEIESMTGKKSKS